MLASVVYEKVLVWRLVGPASLWTNASNLRQGIQSKLLDPYQGPLALLAPDAEEWDKGIKTGLCEMWFL